MALAAAADALGNGSILSSGPLTIGAESDGTDGFEGDMNDVAVFGTALTPAQMLQLAGDTAISKAVLGQFAFGKGWYSAVYFSNTGPNSVSFPVNFIGNDGSPLNVPSIGGATKTVTLAPGGSAVIEAPNVGSDVIQRYVSVTLPAGVTGYGVFRQSVAGVPDQEAVAPLSPVNSSNVSMVYDETNYITGVAIVNPSGVVVTVAVAVSDTNGNLIGTSSVILQPFSKTAVALRDLPALNQIVGTRGTVRFSVSTGNVAVLGLRFFGSAFTSIPAVPQDSRLVGAN